MSKDGLSVAARTPQDRDGGVETTPSVSRSVTPALSLARPSLASFESASAAEWLVTNGLGSFASGTASLASTRRYHGLLVAALAPPVGRRVLVSKCDLEVSYRGRAYALGANEYADGTVHPRGFEHLERFELDGTTPTWTWRVGDLCLRQRVWMADGEQCSFLTVEVLQASATVHLTLVPFCAGRDYHALTRRHVDMKVTSIPGGCVVSMPDCPPCRLVVDAATFEPRHQWHHDLSYRIERERGLDAQEDLFNPGVFRAELAAGEAATLSCSIGAAPPPARLAWRQERGRETALLTRLPAAAPWWVHQLALAADQFIVQREDGHSVIAGYPWFTDWGRDTMIALPGLTLVTGRELIARRVLEAWVAHFDHGLLPNRFPDGGEPPEYNTVDGTLWFFRAVGLCAERFDDAAFDARMYAALSDSAAWHLRGTWHGIHVDPADELLAAGMPGTQLTWMDARADGVEVTPRHGKPVEVNALWQLALRVLARLALRLGKTAEAEAWNERAGRHAQSFRARYSLASGGLHDVLDTPEGGDDASLRPNQLLAVALAPDLLDHARAAAVVDLCVRELWTPFGVRSLAPDDAAYHGRYRGGPAERDAIYHQGTAWTWLLGPLACAHFAVYRDACAALALLEPVIAQLGVGALGTLAEICDGDPPHMARGCFAQAWSVGCVLEAWAAIEGPSPTLISTEIAP